MSEAAERWLTYAELGVELGCTPNAARMHAKRRGWPKRASNRVGGPVHVLVPEDGLVQSPRAMHKAAPCIEPVQPHSNGVQAIGAGELCAAIREAMMPLREQLERERDRADRAEGRAERAEVRIVELQAEHQAERRQHAAERREWLARLTERRPWWRRWLR